MSPTRQSLASQAEVDAVVAAAIAALVDSSPATLDTLNELAAALGDDANFATTLANALAGKQPLDSDLTAIAALTTTAYGRALLEVANQAALKAIVGAALLERFLLMPVGAVISQQGTNASLLLVQARLTVCLMRLPAGFTLDQLSANCTVLGTAGAVFRPAFYAVGATGYPGALLLDPGTMDGTSAAVKTIVVGASLPDLVYVGGVAQGAPATQATWSTITPIDGWQPGLSAAANGAFSKEGITGALPDPFPTGATALQSGVPRLWLRRS